MKMSAINNVGGQNMDTNIETEFVKTNIKHDYQERVLFELLSSKHRAKALSRFAHSSKKILKDRFVEVNTEFLQGYMSKYLSKQNECYLISDASIDGTTMKIYDAWEYIQKTVMMTIVISRDFVLLKEEYEGTKPLFYFCN